jgi:hypothetical protein
MRQKLGSPDTTGQKKEEDKKEKFSAGISMSTIIEKKPSAKVVLKYFKRKFGEDSSDSD